MAEEEKKKELGPLFDKLQKNQQQNQHQAVLDLTDQILQQDKNEESAQRSRLIALIKSKNFDQAVQLIKGNEKKYQFEHAYVLHRQGRNKQALNIINSIKDKKQLQIQYLLAQVQYKLNDYKTTFQVYEDIINNDKESEDIPDIIINMLACCLTMPQQYQYLQDQIISNLKDFEKSYEYFFNISQIQLKQNMLEESMINLQNSFKMAKKDGSEQNDLSRFKIQELHLINQLYNIYTQISYDQDGYILIPKNLKNENLIELNLNSFQDTYEINKTYIKQIIGNLNWRKFSERIKQQLNTNINLNSEQRKLMEVNLIVSMIKSHQYEQAQKEWEKISTSNDHQSLKGIGAFFYLKDNKYNESLNLIKDQKDIYSIFLKSYILLAQKQPVQAFENIIQNMDDKLIQNVDFVIFLLKTCVSYKMENNMKLILQKVKLDQKHPKYKQLSLQLVDSYNYLNQQDQAKEILKQLFDQYLEDKNIQARYLEIVSVDENARQIQQKLKNPVDSDLMDQENYLQQLIDEAMPEKKKEKKTKNVVQEIKGGAEIFIPKKRKAKIKYPKNFDPKNPGPEPDPERWLPKWQRSRFKKYYKKKGLYTKGAQGDAQIDTDVTLGVGSSTAHKDVVTEKQKLKKRGKNR